MPRRGVHGPRPRLATFDYKGAYRYFVTICADEDRSVFAGEWPYEEVVTVLSQVAGKSGFHVLVYTFMPNHVHILVEGEEGADFKEFVRLFKSRTGYSWKRRTGDTLWQKSYYERVLREGEDTRAVARYILENPVRRGLCADAASYPYTGSFVVPLNEILLGGTV